MKYKDMTPKQREKVKLAKQEYYQKTKNTRVRWNFARSKPINKGICPHKKQLLQLLSRKVG